MNEFPLSISLEPAAERGEDCHLAERIGSQILIGVFDGLGGRSAGFNGQTGGQIASKESAQLTKAIVQKHQGILTSEVANEIQVKICEYLKQQAEQYLVKSKIKGSLAKKRLCTTLAIATFPQYKESHQEVEVSLAWIGDSRIYFLSPTVGLRQLTKDDIKENKDALQLLYEDFPMSQYITADSPADWQIHCLSKKFLENGCVLACTDGCFQYFAAPWHLEKLLLETLNNSSNIEDWKQLLMQSYQELMQDDVSLVLYPLGYSDFSCLKYSYQSRLYALNQLINSQDGERQELEKTWEIYRLDYESLIDVAAEKIPEIQAQQVTEEQKAIEHSRVSEKIDSSDSLYLHQLGGETTKNISPIKDESNWQLSFKEKIREFCDSYPFNEDIDEQQVMQIYHQLLKSDRFKRFVQEILREIQSEFSN